ncbi:hypothetical protein CcCBS67573_g00620 [Chytriomyces confervae]|uniref:Uncharacterized protein n=1 Tax=Chytriomyces confervae TaxID=246404 RepID=A0A507FSB9_9FUNG|nr:hypothetical protein CcCBS67573_g00620 [Chytriomyces confervae]
MNTEKGAAVVKRRRNLAKDSNADHAPDLLSAAERGRPEEAIEEKVPAPPSTELQPRVYRRLRSLSTSDIVVDDDEEYKSVETSNNSSSSLLLPNANSLVNLLSDDKVVSEAESSVYDSKRILETYSSTESQIFANEGVSISPTATTPTIASARMVPLPNVHTSLDTLHTDAMVPSTPPSKEAVMSPYKPQSRSSSIARNFSSTSRSRSIQRPSAALPASLLMADLPPSQLNAPSTAGAYANQQHHQQGSSNPFISQASSTVAPVAVIRQYRLWDYLVGQLTSSEYPTVGEVADQNHSVNLKKERIENFLAVPWEFEKLIFLGYLICLDSFLYIFTILPVRILIALHTIFKSIFFRSSRLNTSQKCDLMKGLLVIICCYLLENVDGSRVYHSVRGQSTIKLYVIFNMLEIFDKLMSAFGHDILDSLFSKTTTNSSRTLSFHRLNRVTHFSLALAYVFGHSLILFYQVMALNVAINSHNNTLFSLLLSNQFIEIKGSVFKRFERENLFQLSCADIVERFQLSVFILIICLRNYVELTGATASLLTDTAAHLTTHVSDTLSICVASSSAALDSAVQLFSNNSWDAAAVTLCTETAPRFVLAAGSSLVTRVATDFPAWLAQHSETWDIVMEHIAGPAFAVLGTEFIVDWLKHAFITKFNQLKVNVVYKKYRETLVRDLAAAGGDSGTGGVGVGGDGYVDRSPAVARRIGFVSIPLACLVVRVASQTVRMLCLEEGGAAVENAGIAGSTVFGICAGNPLGLDWAVPREIGVGMDGLSSCVEAVMFGVGDDSLDLKGFKECCVDVFGTVWKGRATILEWLQASAWTIGMWVGGFLGLYCALLAMKLVVGFNLMALAQREIRILASQEASAMHTPVAGALSKQASDLQAAYGQIPSTPVRRKPSGVLSMAESGSNASTGVLPGLGPTNRKLSQTNIRTSTSTVSVGTAGDGGVPIQGGDVNVVALNKDEKLDRVDRFSMVKSRIV